MTLDEIAILRAEAEDRSEEAIKWTYPLRAKAKKTTPCPKPARARVKRIKGKASLGNKGAQIEWQIGSEPTANGYSEWSESTNSKSEWRADLAKRLPKRLTPSRLVEQVIIQNSNGILNNQDLNRMAELCDKLGGNLHQVSSIGDLKK